MTATRIVASTAEPTYCAGMSTEAPDVVLGSRSPRRRELLALLVGEDRILVRPPLEPTEQSLDDVDELDLLKVRLCEIARRKNDDVVQQLRTEGSLASVSAILTADTVIVGTKTNGRPAVLGQPPATDDWQQTVREWFEQYYFGRTHQALTALCVTSPDGEIADRVVSTEVRFRNDAQPWMEWYLASGESLGKAGGYGLQGVGSLFVDRIDGSPSNVIGLPLQETAEMLEQLGVDFLR